MVQRRKAGGPGGGGGGAGFCTASAAVFNTEVLQSAEWLDICGLVLRCDWLALVSDDHLMQHVTVIVRSTQRCKRCTGRCSKFGQSDGKDCQMATGLAVGSMHLHQHGVGNRCLPLLLPDRPRACTRPTSATRASAQPVTRTPDFARPRNQALRRVPYIPPFPL